MKYQISLLIVILLTGCVAMGDKFTQVERFSPETVTVYVLRQSMVSGGFFCADIYEYGKHKGCLKNGGYLKFEAQPGSVLFRIEYMTKNQYRTIEAKAGDVIFIEWYIEMNPDYTTINEVLIHDEEEGVRLLQGLNLSS